MSKFAITGGRRLKGELCPQGAKNEALQVICACLLTKEEVTLSNVPEILDVLKLIELLQGMGVQVGHPAHGEFVFKASDINFDYFETEDFYNKAVSLRGSIMILGPLLAVYGCGLIPKPGGDKIGRRRLDTHFLGFEKLGATFDYNSSEGCFRASAEKLRGCYMLLDEASVTGTANIIMAAVLAEGMTTIYNAACEPYIQQLCLMLNAMGARISAIRNGNIRQLGIIPDSFRRLGIRIEERGDDLYIPRQEHYMIEDFIDGSILTVADAPWPGLTPDLLSVFLVVATQAKGSVLIHQKMFESRLFFVDKLIDMGAKIILCDPHRATVIGQNHESQLRATKMTSPDIRAGIALLIAALSAQGVSTIHNIDQIDRGYEHIDEKLNAIGAEIRRIG